MTIRAECPSCHSVYRLDDRYQGKKVVCKKCRGPIAVGAASPPSRPAAPARTTPTPPARTAPPPAPQPVKSATEPRSAAPKWMIAAIVSGVVAVFGIGAFVSWLVFAPKERAAPPQAVAEVVPVKRPVPAPVQDISPPAAQAEPAPTPPASRSSTGIRDKSADAPVEIGRGNDAPPAAGGRLTAARLQALKDATLFVRVAAGRLSCSGSGFLIRVEGDTGYVITNHHVVNPEAELLVPGRGSHSRTRIVKVVPKNADVTVIFRSGTRNERSSHAEIVATDSSRDLAVLRVSGVEDLPRPIDLEHKAELVETMPVYILGFPFGQYLALKKGNPAITINKGSVSSLRENDYGEMKAVQIDGAINPGNSGGPVVDEQGHLVGIAVATIQGTGIGLAIAPDELSRMLSGRVGGLNLRADEVTSISAKFSADMQLIDPLGRIKSAFVLYVLGNAPQPRLKQNSGGSFDPLPEGTRVDLQIEEQKATGRLEVGLSGAATRFITFQCGYVDGAGKTRYTQINSKVVKEDIAGGPMASAPPARGGMEGPRPDDGVEARTQASGASLAGAEREVEDLTVTEVNVDASHLPRCLCWARDGAAFYCLDHDTGIVRRVAFPSLKEEQRLEAGRIASWLSLSADGLLLALPDVHEVWVLDEESLQPKQKIAAADVDRVVSAPVLHVAFAVSGKGPDESLTILDLKTGKARRQYRGRDVPGLHGGFQLAAATPDGKYLFTQGMFEELLRFRINGISLIYEEASPRIAQNGAAVEVSPDSKYVCLPSGGGNYGAGGYATFIYGAKNLRSPVITVRGGAYPRAVGFDPKRQRVYTQNHDHFLIAFTLGGIKEKEYQLGRADEVKQILPHPDGDRLLVLTARKLYAVALPEK